MQNFQKEFSPCAVYSIRSMNFKLSHANQTRHTNLWLLRNYSQVNFHMALIWSWSIFKEKIRRKEWADCTSEQMKEKSQGKEILVFRSLSLPHTELQLCYVWEMEECNCKQLDKFDWFIQHCVLFWYLSQLLLTFLVHWQVNVWCLLKCHGTYWKKSFIPGSTCTWLKCSLFEVVRFSLNKFTVNTISLKEKVFSCLLKESRFGNSSHCKHESQTNSCHNDIAWYGFLEVTQVEFALFYFPFFALGAWASPTFFCYELSFHILTCEQV